MRILFVGRPMSLSSLSVGPPDVIVQYSVYLSLTRFDACSLHTSDIQDSIQLKYFV